MAIDIGKLLDDLGAKGDDRATLETYFTKNTEAAARANDWRENGLRQADYSRRMNGWSAEETVRRQKIADEEAALLKARDTMNAQYETALADREAAERRAAEIEARAKRVTAEYNLDPKLILGDGVAPANPNPAAPPAANTPDLSGYVPRKEFDSVAATAAQLPNLAVDIHDIMAEAGKLGLNFSARELMDRALKEHRHPRAVFEQEFGAADARQKIHDDAIRAEATAATEARMRTQFSNDSAGHMRPNVPLSPVMNIRPIEGAVRPQAVNRTSSGVDAAMRAMQEGKYNLYEAAQGRRRPAA